MLPEWKIKMNELNEMFKSVVEEQEFFEVVKRNYEAALLVYEEQIKPIRSMMESTQKKLQESIDIFKNEILNNLIENGETPDFPGVHITHQSKMNYREEQAIEFALEYKLNNILSIKKAEFNKIIKNMEQPPEFVTFERIPVIAVSHDLKHLIQIKEEGKATKEDLLPEELK